MPFDATEPWLLRWGVVLGGYLFLTATSGVVFKRSLAWVDDGYPERVSQEDLDVGFLVGKAENLLLYILVLVGAYTGIAVIFAAKGLIRQDQIENDDLYFFAGTFINVTYSVLVAATVAALLHATGLVPTWL